MPKRLIVESSASRSGASRSASFSGASFSGAPKALSHRRRRRRRRPGRRRRRPRRPCRPRRPPSFPLLLSSSLRAPSILCPCHSRRSHRRCRRGPSLPSHIFPRPSSCSSSPLPTCPHPPRRPLLATPNRSQIEADQGGSGRRQRAARGWEVGSCGIIFLFSRNFRRSATSFRPTSLEMQNQLSNEVGRNEVGLAIAPQIRPVQSLDTSEFVTARLRLPNFVPQTLSAN